MTGGGHGGRAARDNSRLQLAALQTQQIDGMADAAGVGDRVADLTAVFARGQMQPSEVRAELLDRVSEAADLVDVWEDTPLKSLTLTSVGLAIGHGYWRRYTDGAAPLSIWIPG